MTKPSASDLQIVEALALDKLPPRLEKEERIKRMLESGHISWLKPKEQSNAPAK